MIFTEHGVYGKDDEESEDGAGGGADDDVEEAGVGYILHNGGEEGIDGRHGEHVFGIVEPAHGGYTRLDVAGVVVVLHVGVEDRALEGCEDGAAECAEALRVGKGIDREAEEESEGEEEIGGYAYGELYEEIDEDEADRGVEEHDMVHQQRLQESKHHKHKCEGYYFLVHVFAVLFETLD